MNPNNQSLLADIHQTLLRAIKQLENTSLDAAFAAWICPSLEVEIDAQLPPQWSEMNYQQVAQLGFLCNSNPQLRATKQDELIRGLTRLTGRTTTITGGARAPFCTDVIALLGLAVGAKEIGGNVQDSFSTWLDSFVEDTCKELPDWKKCIAASAKYLLYPKLPCSLTDKVDSPITQTVMSIRGLATSSGNIDGNEFLLAILSKDVVEDVDSDPCLAAIRLHFLYHLLNTAPTLSLHRPSINDLIKFLERIPSAFRRWTWEDKAKTTTSTIQKWDIQNEYHVQNLLYLLLAPIFPDLDDEFYLNQIGQKNPRADLGIPSMKLIIEVKFVRSNARFQDMIGEVAEDNSLYFSADSSYKHRYEYLLAFVWDDSRRDTEHAVFKRGVEQLTNVVGSVVISRPGSMVVAKS